MKTNKKMYYILFLILILGSSLLFINASEESSMNSKDALKLLKDGNIRFYEGRSLFENLSKKRLQETAKGQKPFATIIGCSDSRESLEHIFDVGIGEIFVIRVAGNVADTDEIGSVEYGVEHLGTPILLVLGHTSCGAVTAVATGAKVTGSIPLLVDNILPAVKKVIKKEGKSIDQNTLISESIKENVWQTIEDILTRSAIVSHLVEQKKLMIIGAIYHLDNGKIEWLGEHPEEENLAQLGFLKNPVSKKKTYELLAISIGASLVIFILFNILFIADKRLFKSIKFKSRLFLSFIAIIISLSLSFYYSNKIYGITDKSKTMMGLMALVPILFTLILSYIFTNKHFNSFKSFFENAVRSANER